MQLCSLELRLGGSLLHTVMKHNVTPAEILVLKHIHGDDAVVNIRPTKFDKTKRQDDVWSELSQMYDQSAGMEGPNDERKSLMSTLFPGAMRKLPTTFDEIGLGHLLPPAQRKAKADAPVPAFDGHGRVDAADGVGGIDDDGVPLEVAA